MAQPKSQSKMGRPPRESFDADQLRGYIKALNERAEKLQAVILGMQAVGLEKIDMAETIAMKDGLDGIRRFCDDGLEVLRGMTKYGDRPWDKWGL